jgi:SAM-dependent methyltransferase
MSDTAKGSPERFGYSWKRFNELTEGQELQFRKWTAPLDWTKDWRGARFLDVGCGAGRNSFWAMKYGATGGVAADVNEDSLEVARRNLADCPGVEVRFESAYDLKDENSFDIVFSIGVIHHLEFPDRALAAMVRAAQPGGTVLIWVYGYENMETFVHVLNPLRRMLFSRMPLGLVWWLSNLPTSALWIGLRLGLGRIKYFELLRALPYRHLRHIIFDQMIPQIANYWRRDEVERLLERAGLSDIRLEWVNEMSWAAVGRKPGD